MPITIEEAVQQVESEIAPLIERGYSIANALTIADRARAIVADQEAMERYEERERARQERYGLIPASP